MSLSPNSSETSFASEAPSEKLSFNINAFNGNTTNFNRACPSPKTTVPLPMPVQPRQEVPVSWTPLKPTSGLIRPM